MVCPECGKPMLDNHCPRPCGWWVCINHDCRVRYVDIANGRVTRAQVEPA